MLSCLGGWSCLSCFLPGTLGCSSGWVPLWRALLPAAPGLPASSPNPPMPHGACSLWAWSCAHRFHLAALVMAPSLGENFPLQS